MYTMFYTQNNLEVLSLVSEFWCFSSSSKKYFLNKALLWLVRIGNISVLPVKSTAFCVQCRVIKGEHGLTRTLCSVM